MVEDGDEVVGFS